jgi:CRISPR system Cascade subunit CasE
VFLTRIEINPNRRASQRALGSPHRMHGAVNACFPPSGQPSRPMWRVDRTRAGTFLYLLSDVKPDPTGFVESHGWPVAAGWTTRSYTPVFDAIAQGRVFQFRVRVNPVRSVRDPDDRTARGRRVGHVTVDQQLSWFVGRSSSWGFSVGADVPTAELVDRKVWSFDRSGQKVTVSTATFEGLLTVTDPDLLRSSLVGGLGPAKAYGCGLLTLSAP